jgi:hypothetical protein
MAKATTVYLTGTLEWAHHLFIPDEFNGIKKWKTNFYPDEKSMETLQQVGSRLKIKDGTFGKYVQVKRECEKTFKPEEGPKALTPPEILTAEGKKWPDDTPIGNGSKATVKIEVYPTRMGNGTRLVGVRIDDLVVYEKPPEGAPAPEALPF